MKNPSTGGGQKRGRKGKDGECLNLTGHLSVWLKIRFVIKQKKITRDEEEGGDYFEYKEST